MTTENEPLREYVPQMVEVEALCDAVGKKSEEYGARDVYVKGLKSVIRTALSAPPVQKGDGTFCPFDPSEEAIDYGAQCLASWQDGCKWPDSWSPEQVSSMRREAEKAYRGMVAFYHEQGEKK